MKRVPSLTFMLDSDEPVPERIGPHTAQRNFFEKAQVKRMQQNAERMTRATEVGYADFVQKHTAGSDGLAAVLLALERGVKRAASRMRHGLRTPSSLESPIVRTAAARAAASGDVMRVDRQVAGLLLEELEGTRVCTVALETAEGLLAREVPSAADAADGEAEGEGEGEGEGEPKAAAAAGDNPADPYAHYFSPSLATAPPRPKVERLPRYALVLHPLDGGPNADAGASVGTIFGVFPVPPSDDSPPGSATHVLRPARQFVAAGCAISNLLSPSLAFAHPLSPSLAFSRLRSPSLAFSRLLPPYPTFSHLFPPSPAPSHLLPGTLSTARRRS